MTDLETAIMIKNMAREIVRQMSAKNANPMQDTIKSVNEEKQRLSKIAGTLDGSQKLVTVYEKQFSEKCRHINDAISEIARVNVLREQRGVVKLI